MNSKEYLSWIPEIVWNKVLYKWEEYNLVRMTIDSVRKTWTPDEIANEWVSAIENDKIFIFWIPEIYLPYVLINEIECAEVAAGEDLCLLALRKELTQVPYNIMDEYLDWRVIFFQNMEQFYQEVRIDELYAREMVKCYEWLKSERKRRQIISQISWMVWKI